MDNAELADVLDEVSELVAANDRAGWRARAWAAGARAVRELEQPVVELLAQGGTPALVELPHIGHSIAQALLELVETRRLKLLGKLRAEVPPAALFGSLPGLGPKLGEAIHETLGLRTLEQLEVAAHDGRLESVRGMGPRRAAVVRAELERRLRHRRARPRAEEPGVGLLLALDRRYRADAEAGKLPKLRPRRMNPERARWLPVLARELGGWQFRLLYSNTARAHALGRTNDWVVVAWERDGRRGQATVVTEWRGPLKGQRVVRGRELECQELAERTAA